MDRMEHEVACDAVAVPPGITDAVAGYRWAQNRTGQSGGTIHRLYGRTGAADLFLKHGTGSVAGDIAAERVRLHWLDGRCTVPRVVRFVANADAAWLLTTALPGETAHQRLVARPDHAHLMVDAVALWLRALHAIPIDTCPFDAGHRHRLTQARRRMEAGLVEEDDFDAERAGWSARQVWDAMQRLLPLAIDPVITHGDCSLDNLLFDGDRIVGCVDVGRAGIADRYQDLAILARSLGAFGPHLAARMFGRYGIAEPDRRRLDFHLMLDEMF